MLETILLPSLTVLAAAWALASALRRRRAIAAGSFTTASVLALAWAATAFDFGPWMEGGIGMNLLAIAGSYALGAAVASRLAPGRGPRAAAIIGVALTAIAGVGFYVQSLAVVDEAVRHADPVVAAQIREAGAAEAVRTVELAGLVGALALAILVTRPRRGQGARLAEGVELETGERTTRAHDRALSALG